MLRAMPLDEDDKCCVVGLSTCRPQGSIEDQSQALCNSLFSPQSITAKLSQLVAYQGHTECMREPICLWALNWFPAVSVSAQEVLCAPLDNSILEADPQFEGHQVQVDARQEDMP
jgi:hypothetical protein